MGIVLWCRNIHALTHGAIHFTHQFPFQISAETWQHDSETLIPHSYTLDTHFADVQSSRTKHIILHCHFAQPVSTLNILPENEIAV